MEYIDEKENKLVFSVEINESLANAIRRYVNEVPSLAVDEVEIMKNDSALYDETVAHRIGLIPLKTDKVKEGEVVQLKLNVSREGPVYSGDLKGGADVVYGKIPITILQAEQEMEILATARLGTGKEHAKFTPGVIFYRNMKEIKTGSRANEITRILSSCPNKCGNKKKDVENNKTYELDICDACEDEISQLKIEMIDSPKLVVTIESFGQLSIKEIFLGSIKELKKNLNEISKKI